MKFLIFLLVSFSCAAKSIYVSEGDSLSDAVNSSVDGDVIYVSSGEYYCDTVIVKSQISIIGSKNSRPAFYGCGEDVFIKIYSDNVNVSYIKTVDYKSSIRYYGNRNNFEENIDGGSLYGMYFYGGYNSSGFVVLVNADNIRIENSHFIYGNNSASFHGVYLAHSSSNNYIARNRFIDISGDPIRVRDLSNYNKVYSNYFESSGYYATFSDWYCEDNCTKEERECRSYGNEFRSNNVDFNMFKKWGSDTVCGSLPAPWLRTSGNY